jgi:hypothetical protein
MTNPTATMIPAPMVISVRIQPMNAIPKEGQAKIGEKVLTEGAT